MTSSKTKLIGAIGYPNRVARTPMIMSVFAEETRLDFAYLLFEFPPRQLRAAVEGLKTLGAAGFNVTMPYKQAILEYLDDVDDGAAQLNAVNTVRIDEDGRLYGSNTDYFGFLQSLRDMNVSVADATITVLGAGAVSGPVSLALTREGAAHVTWLNRTEDKAAACAAKMNEHKAGMADFGLLTSENLNRQLRTSDILVDITPVGMATNAIKMHEFDVSLLNESKLVYHIVYAPWETPLLRIAREHGARIINGARMSVRQAERAFEIWTGTKIYDATVEKALRRVEEDVCE